MAEIRVVSMEYLKLICDIDEYLSIVSDSKGDEIIRSWSTNLQSQRLNWVVPAPDKDQFGCRHLRLQGLIAQLNVKPGACMSPGCREPAVRSHTAPKSLLKRCAHNDDLVAIVVDRSLEPVAKRQRLAAASTFRGFCINHDKTIFAPIEDREFKGDSRQFVLAAYKATCHQVRCKINDAKALMKAIAVEAKSQSSSKDSAIFVIDLTVRLDFLKDQLNCFLDVKKLLEAWIDAHGDPFALKLMFDFEVLLPIVIYGANSAVQSITGKILPDENARLWDLVFYSTFEVAGRSRIAISYLGDRQRSKEWAKGAEHADAGKLLAAAYSSSQAAFFRGEPDSLELGTLFGNMFAYEIDQEVKDIPSLSYPFRMSVM